MGSIYLKLLLMSLLNTIFMLNYAWYFIEYYLTVRIFTPFGSVLKKFKLICGISIYYF